MFSDFPRDAPHVIGFPHKDVLLLVEDVDECAFLFGREFGSDAYHPHVDLLGVQGHFLHVDHRFEGRVHPLCIRHLLVDCSE